jgi:ubiquinone/menaquinone biosynthesis C-methylase UbiE
LDPSNIDTCLDIGSGWGTSAFSLANYFDEVWSLENQKHKIEFQRIRQEQEKIKNLMLVRADCLNLPFPENYFNLVALNNSLDWLEINKNGINFKDIPKDIFKEIQKILKPDGCLFLGKNNLFRYPFTNFRLQKSSQSLIKDKKGKWNNYHENLHCFWGYKKILKEAGFNQVEIYWTLDYNIPKFSGRFDGESYHFYLNWTEKNKNLTNSNSILDSILAHSPRNIIKFAFPFICPSFLIFAYKKYKGNSFESRLMELKKPTSSFIKISGSTGIESKINYLLLEKGKPHAVLKFPRFKEYKQLSLEEEKMSQFNQLDIQKNEIGSFKIFTEPYIRAKPFKLNNFFYHQAVLNWLLDFQSKTQHGFWEYRKFEAKIVILKNFLLEISIDKKIRLRTEQSLDLLLDALKKAKLLINAEHGDFTPVNIIIGYDNKIYIMDWEFFEEEGDPLFDFVFYILACASFGNFPHTFRKNFTNQGKNSPILKDLIVRFSKAKDISSELVYMFIPYVILRLIHRAAYSEERKHINVNRYIIFLKLWDEVFPISKFK